MLELVEPEVEVEVESLKRAEGVHYSEGERTSQRSPFEENEGTLNVWRRSITSNKATVILSEH